MKRGWTFSMLVLAGVSSIAQGRVLTFDDLRHWPGWEGRDISPDGKVATYVIKSEADPAMLVIEGTDGSWVQRWTGASQPVISSDSRFVVFSLGKDSVGVYSIGTRRFKVFTDLQAFRLPRAGPGRWLAAKSGVGDTAWLMDIATGVRDTFPSVRAFQFSPDGHNLWMEERLPGSLEQITCFNPSSRIRKIICRLPGHFSAPVFDGSGGGFAFFSTTETRAKLMYYAFGTDSAVERVGERVPGMPKGMEVDPQWPIQFTAGGRRLVFWLKRIEQDKINSAQKSANVTIWNYADAFLPSQRVKDNYGDADLKPMAVVATQGDNQIVCITKTGDRKISFCQSAGTDDALVTRFSGNINEEYWRAASKKQIDLVSLADGSRKVVADSLWDDFTMPALSPAGKFVIWYDIPRGAYFTFEVATGRVVNISGKVPSPLACDMAGQGSPKWSFGVAAWEKEDDYVLLNDQYDVWRVDPKGERPPVNLTQSYGRDHKTQLHFMGLGEAPVVHLGESILFWGQDSATKDFAYYSMVLGAGRGIDKRMSGRVMSNTYPTKARDAEAYLVVLESRDSFPNLFITRDFRTFKPLSDIHPQAGVTWYDEQLIHWKTFDGSQETGLLFKPKDLDSSRRYPVLFFLYEGSSGDLNNFCLPRLSSGEFNITWFVNHGYVVCVPDMQYSAGSPGEGAYNSVASCARFLSGLPWVDSTKMGIQGVSFGGFEVNYIVTRTNLFAAACSASGISDLASVTYALRSDVGESAEYVSEQTQMRMRGPVWKYPEDYMRNSPLYHADEVTTPLLIMANDGDGKVPWTQGVEWFLALRRLQRPVWMLQYNGDKHTLVNTLNQEDYTERMMQFFDHYLKGGPLPVWMLQER